MAQLEAAAAALRGERDEARALEAERAQLDERLGEPRRGGGAAEAAVVLRGERDEARAALEAERAQPDARLAATRRWRVWRRRWPH
ncbi:MAG: hypothetical protein U0802_12520 [Candidatus Binatia bacterium]